MRALEKRPEDRYQSAEEMRHDLEEFLDESGLRSGNRRVAHLHEGAVRARRADVGRGRRGVARVREPRPRTSRRRRAATTTRKSWTSIAARRSRCASRPAPEPAAPAARGSSAGSGSARVAGRRVVGRLGLRARPVPAAR